MTNALEIRGLKKSYGKRRALDGLDLTVNSGSIFGLVGANGAGKTTMMSICAGLLKPDGGSVNLLGDGAFDPVKHTGRVTILPQDSRLPLHARIADLMQFYGQLQCVPKAELPQQIEQLLAWVNLADRAKSPVKSLSHGMMRRLTVAQAFLGEPKLIFLDEPMSGLDPREVARMRELLTQRRGKQTIVISSHVLTELEALCDTIAFVDKGRLLKQGSLASIVRHHHRITYRIRLAPLPLDELKTAIPGADWKLENGGTDLNIYFDGALAQDTAAVNARVLAILLAANIGIEEIRRGSDLESEYLAATEPAAR